MNFENFVREERSVYISCSILLFSAAFILFVYQVASLTSGPSIVLALQKDSAILAFDSYLGRYSHSVFELHLIRMTLTCALKSGNLVTLTTANYRALSLD